MYSPRREQSLRLLGFLVALIAARADTDTGTSRKLRHDVGIPAVAAVAAVTVQVQALV